MALNRSDADIQMKQLYNFMCDDTVKAISAGSNYLAALGLSTYTEILGGYHRGRLSRNNSRDNYEDFLFSYFPTSYEDADDDIRNNLGLGGLYEVVRCGLTHEYYIKMQSTVELGTDTPLPCGLVVDTSNRNVKFIVKQYFRDFKESFDKYYAEFRSGANASVLLGYFNNALGSIDSVLLTNPSHVTMTSGAGVSVQGLTPPPSP